MRKLNWLFAVLALAPAVASAHPEPFAFADFTWLNGSSRQTEFPLQTSYFTGQLMIDSNLAYSFANPSDHTLVGSTNTGRVNELQIQHFGLGGDFHFKNVRGRLMTQLGMYATMTPRNDASPSRGQWNLADAFRYVSEAYGGYHFDVWHGLNVDAGIFMSYIGLCSYYNYENWVYQMSHVSANTPWFFNGVRVQAFPSERLKLELWLINGWQSYASFNQAPGVGLQVLWRPTGSWSIHSNNYFGYDTLGNPDRVRVHTDDSVQFKYFDRPGGFLSRGAFSLTADAGCENGGGVSCFGQGGQPAQYFLGFMVYNRLWFWQNQIGLTLGAGAMSNPGRYLVLLPPINGTTAASGSPYFTASPGDDFKAWDASATLDYMPSEWVTLRIEYIHREASVNYFAGPGGVTPPGGNTGSPSVPVPGWQPSLVPVENRLNAALIIRL